jgi:hypothetical protein
LAWGAAGLVELGVVGDDVVLRDVLVAEELTSMFWLGADMELRYIDGNVLAVVSWEFVPAADVVEGRCWPTSIVARVAWRKEEDGAELTRVAKGVGSISCVVMSGAVVGYRPTVLRHMLG